MPGDNYNVKRFYPPSYNTIIIITSSIDTQPKVKTQGSKYSLQKQDEIYGLYDNVSRERVESGEEEECVDRTVY